MAMAMITSKMCSLAASARRIPITKIILQS